MKQPRIKKSARIVTARKPKVITMTVARKKAAPIRVVMSRTVAREKIPEVAHDDVWVTQDGQKIPVWQIGHNHAHNIIRMLLRRERRPEQVESKRALQAMDVLVNYVNNRRQVIRDRDLARTMDEWDRQQADQYWGSDT